MQLVTCKAKRQREAAARRQRERCNFPADRADFRSVLALGYKASDSFRWHTDMAGDEGWVFSFSLGATASFEYLPAVAPSAKRRAEARKAVDPVRVLLGCGDCLLFHGGFLAHRVSHSLARTSLDATRKRCRRAPH